MKDSIVIIIIFGVIYVPIIYMAIHSYNEIEQTAAIYGCKNLFIPLSNNQILYDCINRASEERITSFISKHNELVEENNMLMNKLELKLFILDQLKSINATQGKN